MTVASGTLIVTSNLASLAGGVNSYYLLIVPALIGFALLAWGTGIFTGRAKNPLNH